jgi:hypothetical protein
MHYQFVLQHEYYWFKDDIKHTVVTVSWGQLPLVYVKRHGLHGDWKETYGYHGLDNFSW